MATADELLGDIAPELAGVGTERRARILAFAEARTGVGVFPDDVRPMAVALMAAHLLTLAGRAGAGAVTSESVGPLSQSYAVGADLSSTPYGSELLSLRRGYVFGPRTRVPG